MLAVPFANDQFQVAKRIVENGLGETAELASITPEKLRDAITRLAGNDEIRTRCREAAADMLSGPTREDTAAAIEELIRKGS
jgi:UDP:flavonoid glycosyltransferase YjiC (YdhE family)